MRIASTSLRARRLRGIEDHLVIPKELLEEISSARQGIVTTRALDDLFNATEPIDGVAHLLLLRMDDEKQTGKRVVSTQQDPCRPRRQSILHENSAREPNCHVARPPLIVKPDIYPPLPGVS